VRQALLEMLQQVQRNGFDTQTRAAWVQLYDFIQSTMLRGADKEQNQKAEIRKQKPETRNQKSEVRNLDARR
jgi:hypothetical protein